MADDHFLRNGQILHVWSGEPGQTRTQRLFSKRLLAGDECFLRRSFLPFSSLFPADLRSAENPVKSGISNELLCSHFLRCSSRFPVCISRLLATANIGGWPFLHPPHLLAEMVAFGYLPLHHWILFIIRQLKHNRVILILRAYYGIWHSVCSNVYNFYSAILKFFLVKHVSA